MSVNDAAQAPSGAGRMPLFRSEVAERHWELLESRGLRPHPPRHVVATIVLLAATFVVAGTLLARGAVARLEFTTGYLEPTAGVVRIRVPRQGTVSRLHVQAGQHAERGAALVTVQSGQTTESGGLAEAEMALQLEGQRRDLEDQLGHEGRWRQSEERRLAAAVEEAEHSIESLGRTRQRQQEQLALMERHADSIRSLAHEGTISRDELHRRDLAVLTERQTVEASTRELAARQAQLKTARVSIEQLPTIAAERLRGLRENLANVQQRLIELDARRAMLVRAPVGGTVASLPAFVGAALNVDSPIATIVPDGSELRARLLVPARAIGKVRPGQRVSIRYDAFPYQKYGTFKGRVAGISNTMTLPSESDRMLPVKLGEPAYMVDVDIERQRIAIADNREVELRPDMLLTAAIEVDRSPLLTWIGESLFGVGQR